jgi:hypothetical protein
MDPADRTLVADAAQLIHKVRSQSLCARFRQLSILGGLFFFFFLLLLLLLLSFFSQGLSAKDPATAWTCYATGDEGGGV